ncbi:hypothetical protein D6829_02745 [Candidatus Pacearchaeota archaeon]|nr:MAG: hypothetical protein D6829_02745 [Candidatus Pacearchaeota archaeon]
MKKGSSHIEIVMAFIFFIAFVAFTFSIVRPYNPKQMTGSALLTLEKSLIKKTEVNLSSYFLKSTLSDPRRQCSITPIPETIKINKESNSFTTTYPNEAHIDSKISGRKLFVKKSKKSNYYNVRISEEFAPQKPAACINADSYYIGGINEKKVASNKSLSELTNKYRTKYEKLKEELGIPQKYDFSIISPDMPQFNMKKSPPQTAEVYSKTIVLEILNEKGEIKNARFQLRVW